ncbi:MAG: acyl-CoA dehydrogenase [Lautropia sp.]|nr:acyl-CoA dehydrogenase [Lautropia sp.]
MASRNLGFLLYEWLNLEHMLQRPRFAGLERTQIDLRLQQVARLAKDKLMPINRTLDEQEPCLDGEMVMTAPVLGDALKAICGLGLLSAAHDRELGGAQLPVLVEKAMAALLNGGSATTYAYIFPSQAVGKLLRTQASSWLQQHYLSLILAGRAFSSFCISEPQAGSSLADIRMRAIRQPDGSFRLYGHKMWITCGDQEISENIVHVVAAKIEGENGEILPGTRHLSLFVVPKYLQQPDGRRGERNDIVADSLTLKMGQKGAPSCLLSFGEGYHRPQGEAGAVAWLLGEPDQGLAMINDASNELRIDIGLSAAALGYTGYLHSLDYASERLQGRVPGTRSADSGQIPIIGHADIRRMLLSQKAYTEGGLALGLWCARQLDDMGSAEQPGKREHAAELLAMMAPVLKSWTAQWCLQANSLAIEVLGSYGYTRDYPLEQLYRDNRLNTIQEGTHGIQSLELLRYQLEKGECRLYRRFEQEVLRTVDRAAARGGDGRYMSILLRRYAERIGELLCKIYCETDLTRRLANASVFMELFGHYVIAWIWLEQWLVAEVALLSAYGPERNFYAGKCQTALFFFRSELPRIDHQLLVLEQMDMTAAEMRPEWF